MSVESAADTTGGEQEPPAKDGRRLHVWQQQLRPARRGDLPGIDGAMLAALRRGVGREPGTVPEMWPHYRELTADGHVTRRLRAEHITMALFGVHQQSKSQPVHRQGVGVGRAMAALRDSNRFSGDAVDRRFVTFATATSLAEIETHLRGLITQLRDVEGGALDYTQLFHDLVRWQDPDQAPEVRRRWGSQYFVTPTTPAATSSSKES